MRHTPPHRKGDEMAKPTYQERRQFQRFDIDWPGLFRELDPPEGSGDLPELQELDPIEEMALLDELGPMEELDPADSPDRMIQGRTRNISLGGALVEMADQVQPGCWIQFACGGGTPVLEIRARVLACDPEGELGYLTRIQFHQIDDASQALLEAWIEDSEAGTSLLTQP